MNNNTVSIRETLDKFYKELYLDRTCNYADVSRSIDMVLSKAYHVDSLSLFLLRINKKDCVQNLKKLLADINSIDDAQVARALSSLVTHSLLEMEKDVLFYKSLRISEQTNLLSSFIEGDITKSDVIKFYEPYLK